MEMVLLFLLFLVVVLVLLLLLPLLLLVLVLVVSGSFDTHQFVFLPQGVQIFRAGVSVLVSLSVLVFFFLMVIPPHLPVYR